MGSRLTGGSGSIGGAQPEQLWRELLLHVARWLGGRGGLLDLHRLALGLLTLRVALDHGSEGGATGPRARKQ